MFKKSEGYLIRRPLKNKNGVTLFLSQKNESNGKKERHGKATNELVSYEPQTYQILLITQQM